MSAETPAAAIGAADQWRRPAPPRLVNDAARAHRQRRHSRRASIAAAAAAFGHSSLTGQQLTLGARAVAREDPGCVVQRLLAQLSHGLTPGIVSDPESDADDAEDIDGNAADAVFADAVAARSAWQQRGPSSRGGGGSSPATPPRHHHQQQQQRGSTASSKPSVTAAAATNGPSADESELALAHPVPWTQHVVARHRTYWATSRRHLLLRGKSHGELGIQTATGTRDYVAAAKSVMSLLALEERHARAAVANTERGAYAALCEAATRDAAFWTFTENPLIVLSVMEFRRRDALMSREARERGFVLQHRAAVALIQWAQNDRNEARERARAAEGHLAAMQSRDSASSTAILPPAF